MSTSTIAAIAASIGAAVGIVALFLHLRERRVHLRLTLQGFSASETFIGFTLSVDNESAVPARRLGVVGQLDGKPIPESQFVIAVLRPFESTAYSVRVPRPTLADLGPGESVDFRGRSFAARVTLGLRRPVVIPFGEQRVW